MPIGSPKPQTIATKKYEQKAGFVSKSYKLRRELVGSVCRRLREGRHQPGGTAYKNDEGLHRGTE